MTSTPRQSTSRRTSRTNVLVFAVALLGLTLFILARLGVTALPFDQHHVLTQLIGIGLVLGALTQWR
jgi:hypothetical protein